MNPGYDRPDHQGFRRKATYDCLFCLTDGYLQDSCSIQSSSESLTCDTLSVTCLRAGVSRVSAQSIARCPGPAANMCGGLQTPERKR